MSGPMSESYFPTLTPYIVVRDAKAAIAFYEKAFGAKVRNIAYVPDSEQVMNAQLVFGDSVLMLNDEFPDYGSFAPQAGEKIPVTIHISSKDIDNDFQRAIDAGAEVRMPLADMFWGDRYGSVQCPFGYNWSMGQKMRDMSAEEVESEMAEAFAQKD
jgi:PhnB protein